MWSTPVSYTHLDVYKRQVEFRLEKPTQEGVDDVRDAISRIRADLPGELKDPVIARVNLAGSPILTYTVASSRLDDEALSWLVDNTLTKAMLSVRGVGAVARVGGVSREIRIELDPARLLALHATAADVSRQLRPVSYTHLDVYKRQINSLRNLASVDPVKFKDGGVTIKERFLAEQLGGRPGQRS